MLTACSVEKKNDEMHQFVASQEHDERLFGWWQIINSPTNYVYYDNDNYNHNSCIIDESGNIKAYDTCWYWYTKDMWIYVIRDATPLTGLINSRIEYRISDDNEYILTKVNGEFSESYKKVHEELQIVE
jgi:hypothetical protein